MRVEWREHLSVGVEEIDAQHRSLFEKFNTLMEACDQGKGGGEVVRLFGFLDNYINTHFADEERLQQRLGFPDHERHREQHQKFISELAAMKERLFSEGLSRLFVAGVNRLMTGWLIEHISGMDRAFGKFARQEGSISA
ncbi:MAG: hemerythrin family protein [Geobacteraceae bacterium]|nr:hemerythrin family protein [Geobacteraceae bacterium]